MKQSESVQNLAAALVKAQSAMRVLPKSAKGYGYSYTPLDVIVDAIRQPLAENGLSFIQMPTIADGVGLTTRLLHESGEWIEETAVLPLPTVGKSNEAQAYGAGLTYLRRYAISAMLGLATDEDVDASPRNDTPSVHGAGVPKPPSKKNGNKPEFDRAAWYEYIIGQTPHYKNKHHIDGALTALNYHIPETREQGLSLVEPLKTYAKYREMGKEKDEAVDLVLNGEEPLFD